PAEPAQIRRVVPRRRRVLVQAGDALGDAARVALGVDDAMRADKALKGVIGKRLTYRATRSARP
ncbi:MAG: hypothetical protein AAB403_03060, partial [Planctomycetota bacterium]